MNILFFTLGRMDTIEGRGIYTDLLREFRNRGHSIYVVAQREKRTGLPTEMVEENGARLLHVRIGNITKCGSIEKGISTLRIEGQYLKAIKKHFSDVRFDLVMYSTPPITFVGAVDYIKKRDGAKTYLLLKDIFPQNAVDIGMMSKKGIYGILYRYFRKKEKKLYAVSDFIGCMSRANVDYVLKHNPEVSPDKVEICPNSIDVTNMRVDTDTRLAMREKYGIPTDKKVFVYGGNLGKPQGIPFLIECLRAAKAEPNAHFLIVGDGTEYRKLEEYAKAAQQDNLTLMKKMPKKDYDRLVSACDVGMIFLDHRFTIPNFPSRLLSVLQAAAPVLACTDANTDIGKIIMDGGFGWWCESNDASAFANLVSQITASDIKSMGEAGYKYLEDNYTVSKAYDIIAKHFI